VTESAETRLKGLVQQYEKLRRDVASKAASADRDSQRQTSLRVQELEAQLAEVRHWRRTHAPRTHGPHALHTRRCGPTTSARLRRCRASQMPPARPQRRPLRRLLRPAQRSSVGLSSHHPPVRPAVTTRGAEAAAARLMGRRAGLRGCARRWPSSSTACRPAMRRSRGCRSSSLQSAAPQVRTEADSAARGAPATDSEGAQVTARRPSVWGMHGSRSWRRKERPLRKPVPSGPPTVRCRRT